MGSELFGRAAPCALLLVTGQSGRKISDLHGSDTRRSLSTDRRFHALDHIVHSMKIHWGIACSQPTRVAKPNTIPCAT